MAVAFAVGLWSAASANVWINEDFDGDVAAPWSQGNGLTGDPGTGTVDYFDTDGSVSIQTLPLITQTGTVVSTKSFNGSSSYELAPGQAISVADGYDGSAHGNTIYHQFALNVDPIPASAGPVARFAYNVGADGTAFRYFINLDADGAGNVAITGGEDLATTWSTTFAVATLNSNTQWVYLTAQYSTGTGNADDVRSPINPLPPGYRIYADSTTPAGTVTIPGSTNKDGRDWSLTNLSGTASVYVDDLYWDGAMEGGDIANHDLQKFDKAQGASDARAVVRDWPLYKNR